jgi:phosphatidylserine/phosphatidylglycerophosphate/cardiolipin synthase-like enzyme
VFGTSNWSDASDDNQLEANIFTDQNPSGGTLNDSLFSELNSMFIRKFYNTTGSRTSAF